MSKMKGFTLLELIVGMAIVAVLLGLSVIGIQSVQRSQRDTERREALNAINLEVEAYRGNQGSYPAASAITISPDGKAFCIGSGCQATATLRRQLAGGSAAPNTAGNTTGTFYCYTSSSGAYGIAVSIEGSTTPFGLGSTAISTCTAHSGVTIHTANF